VVSVFPSSYTNSDHTDPVAKTILIVTDHFGASLNPEKQFETESTQAMALQLSAAGFLVSVLYTGTMEEKSGSRSQVFENVARDMKAKGIQISQYTQSLITLDLNRLESTMAQITRSKPSRMKSTSTSSATTTSLPSYTFLLNLAQATIPF
jgi:hypothetical protein